MRTFFLCTLGILLLVISACSAWRVATLPSNPDTLIKNVIGILDRYRIQTDIDKESIGFTDAPSEQVVGYDVLAKKIETFVIARKKLRLFLVSFPYKSSNIEKKVLGSGVDLAERKSLEYLYGMIKELKTVYPYGVELAIFCDGAPFADYRAIADSVVKAYEKGLATLTEDMPEITLITSREIEKRIGTFSPQEIRTRIDSFAPSNVEAMKLIETDPKTRDSYLTLLERFKLEFDSEYGRSFLAQNNGLENVIRLLIARELRMRAFIETYFDPSTYVRLTVHYSQDVGKKFGIRLSPNSVLTPYHAVLVEDKTGAWALRYKKDIDFGRYEELSKMVNGLNCKYMRER